MTNRDLVEIAINPRRFEILRLLMRENPNPLIPTYMAHILDMPLDTVTHHCVVLKKAKLVLATRNGANVYYLPDKTLIDNMLATLAIDLTLGGGSHLIIDDKKS